MNRQEKRREALSFLPKCRSQSEIRRRSSVQGGQLLAHNHASVLFVLCRLLNLYILSPGPWVSSSPSASQGSTWTAASTGTVQSLGLTVTESRNSFFSRHLLRLALADPVTLFLFAITTTSAKACDSASLSPAPSLHLSQSRSTASCLDSLPLLTCRPALRAY